MTQRKYQHLSSASQHLADPAATAGREIALGQDDLSRFNDDFMISTSDRHPTPLIQSHNTSNDEWQNEKRRRRWEIVGESSSGAGGCQL